VATDAGRKAVVERLSFDVAAGETLCIAGESGSGKSMTALAIMGLLPQPMARIAGGSIRLAGRDLAALSERQMRGVRGADVAMIFQEPMTSLNPVLTIGRQLVEAIRVHRRCVRGRVAPAGHRGADRRADRRARAPAAPISARAFGRHAPARHDRHGAGR
jgi:peptide/nickel transport system ATP-binding protein